MTLDAAKAELQRIGWQLSLGVFLGAVAAGAVWGVAAAVVTADSDEERDAKAAQNAWIGAVVGAGCAVVGGAAYLATR